MGTWSHEAFGNDTASDWAFVLEETNDLTLLESTLDAVLDAGGEYLDAADAEAALAAIEVIAHLQGRPGNDEPETEVVRNWVERTALKPGPELLAKAHRVIDRILGKDSELAELWQEAGEEEPWSDAVRDLKARITA